MNVEKKRNVLELATVSRKEVLRQQGLKNCRLVANHEFHFNTLWIIESESNELFNCKKKGP